MKAKKIDEKRGALQGQHVGRSKSSGATTVEWQSRRHDPTLGRYFRDLAEHEVLDSDREAEEAEKISRLEISLWSQILENTESVEPILKMVGNVLETDPSYEDVAIAREGLKKATRRLASVKRGTKAGPMGYRNAAEELAAVLYEVDLKRELVIAAQKEVERFAKTLPSEESKQQVARIHKAARAVELSKHRFIRANLRLVVAIARRYDRGQMPLIDLIQEGNLGLIKAVDRFDYRRGFRFSTYASWWIRHAIGRALADKGHAVRVPVHALDTQHRLARATEAIGLKFGRPPTDEELVDATGLDKGRLARARKHTVVPVTSLDKNVSDSDDRRFVDLVVDEQAKSPFESTLLKTWTNEMEEVLDILTPIERTIIRWRYGLDDGEEMTLKEIGDHYNLSRERIRQLQQQALMKIRRRLELDAA